MAIGTLLPLVISPPDPVDLNFTPSHSPYAIAPLTDLGHIYTHYEFSENSFDSGTWFDYIFEHSSSDGSAERTKLISDVCVISNNQLLCDPAFTSGTDNNIYAITTSGDPDGFGLWWLDTMCLSKIDPVTLTEIDTIVPYAVANSYAMGSEQSFQLTPFQLNSVNYIAITLSTTTSGNCNIEVINVDTMTSVDTIDYHIPSPPGSSPHSWCIQGDQESATHQNLYIWMSRWDTLGEYWFYKIELISGSLSVSTIKHADSEYTTSGNPMFDPEDNNIVLWVTVQPAPNPSNRYLQKISTVNGSVVWQSIELPVIPGATWNGNGVLPMQTWGQSNLTGGHLFVLPGDRYPVGYTPPWTDVANEGTYLDFDTSDGTYTAASLPALYHVFGDNFIDNTYKEKLPPQLSIESINGFYLWVSPSFTGNTYAGYTDDWIGGWIFTPFASPPVTSSPKTSVRWF